VTSRRFSPVSSTTKTDRHGLTEILLKVALNTLLQPKEMSQGQQSNQKNVEIWVMRIEFVPTVCIFLGFLSSLRRQI
jgi:hypothetical protein